MTGDITPTEWVTVKAKILNETVIQGNRFADEGKTRNVSNLPENLDAYKPMPIPIFNGDMDDFSDEESPLVIHDSATQEEIILEPLVDSK